ncbi:gamma-mobile-trio recombinase GmtY, partial [Photobacterium gaetbulicola]|uniref:gamma-mobile-trio recombinase GmtY n=1 Tax=Photobacterium gaetbulicola TaxID=1295392 RepID=UPI0009DDD282
FYLDWYKQGVFEPLLDYVLSQYHARSQPWMNRVVFACQLLLEYMQANRGLYSSPTVLFSNFVNKLSLGTINHDGHDPSGLYWLPRSVSNTNQLISALNGLTDWLVLNNGESNLNPLEEASSYQQALNYAAWHKKNQFNFLGHLKPHGLSDMVKKARKLRGKRDVIKVDDDAIAFSEAMFKPFFIDGLGSAKDYRVRLRDQLIVLLMHGVGVRESDALHLWVEDVYEDPDDCNSVIVRLFHPEDGKAPNNWRGRNKQQTRSAYLAEVFGLRPRNQLTGTARVGWKTRIVDHSDNYIQLCWFPSYLGQLFRQLWREYLRLLLPLERFHPYAFVSFSVTTLGQPLTLNAFNCNYRAALSRIGLTASKVEGLSPHAHRHAFGRRLTEAGLDPILIKKALHHASLSSQLVYTQPGIREVTKACHDATSRLDGIQHPVVA